MVLTKNARCVAVLCMSLCAGLGRPMLSAAAALDVPNIAAPSNESKPSPKVFAKSFTGTFKGVRVNYTATAGETFIKNERGENVASMFSVAYVMKDAQPHRPVIFLFNGGPGTSSLFLHIGAFGPKRVVVPSEAQQAGNPPFTIEDNTRTLLDVADLVFIDPIGTGYSRALGTTDPKIYWGLKEDARVITEFVRIWLTNNGRWNAPKYLLGESYGTTRSVQMVEQFRRSLTGAMLNGVILLSTVLDLQSVVFSPGNDAPYISYLPTYAAVALLHGKINPRPEDPAKFLADARAFAINEYSVALLQGSRLTESERHAIVEKLAFFTGLSREYVAQAQLRVSAERFRKELLRDRGKVIGLLDGRYLGEDSDDAGETPQGDPSSISGAYTSAYLDYLTRVLSVKFDAPYRGFNRDVSQNWKWSEASELPTSVNLGPILGEAMRGNRDFRVFLGNGIYDFSTPIFGAEQTFAHNGIKAERVTEKAYAAGHMMYTHVPSADALADDIRNFIRDGSANAADVQP